MTADDPTDQAQVRLSERRLPTDRDRLLGGSFATTASDHRGGPAGTVTGVGLLRRHRNQVRAGVALRAHGSILVSRVARGQGHGTSGWKTSR